LQMDVAPDPNLDSLKTSTPPNPQGRFRTHPLYIYTSAGSTALSASSSLLLLFSPKGPVVLATTCQNWSSPVESLLERSNEPRNPALRIPVTPVHKSNATFLTQGSCCQPFDRSSNSPVLPMPSTNRPSRLRMPTFGCSIRIP
jgi:hypothetical protein